MKSLSENYNTPTMISGETMMCKVKTLHENLGRRTKDIWGEKM